MAASSSGASSKSKIVEVLHDPRRGDGLRDGLTSLLKVPAQHHLGRGLAVRGGDLSDGRVLEGAAVGSVPVEGDAADRRPGLGEDAVLGVDREQRGLAEVGVDLDLVDRGHHGCRVRSRARWSGMKLLTPIARTLPSARRVSSAW